MKQVCRKYIPIIFISILFLSGAFSQVWIVKVWGEDTQALTAPRWITINEYRGGVNLRWFRVQGAASYKVLRRVGEQGEFQELGRVENPVFDDMQVFPGNAYFYRIVPYDLNARAGPPSETRNVFLAKPESEQLSPPEWSVTRVTSEGIALNWSHKSPSSVLAFNLFRRESKEEVFQLLTSSVDTIFLDRNVVAGKTYSYVLTAISKTLQESNYSAIMVLENTPPARKAQGKTPFSSVRTLEEVLIRTESLRNLGWEEYGFVSPVDIAFLASNRNLYVSDTATGLITVINEQGEPVARFGGKGQAPWEFECLLGITLDSNGYLYALDAYVGHIVVFDPRFQFLYRIPLLPKVEKYFKGELYVRYPGFRFGVVDIGIGPQGTLIITDNSSAWIYILDKDDNLIKVVGGKGEAPGSMHNPNFLLIDRRDQILVSDGLNSRVQVFSSSGAPEQVIGERGLGIGQFIRPKGLAQDTRGNIYVADSYLNAIQVFSQTGDYVGLLANEQGLPLDLGLPNGILFIEPYTLAVSSKISRQITMLKIPVGELKPVVKLSSPGAAGEPEFVSSTPRSRLQIQENRIIEVVTQIRGLAGKGGKVRISEPLFQENSSVLLPSALQILYEVSNLVKRSDLQVQIAVLALDPSRKSVSLALGQDRVKAILEVIPAASNLNIFPLSSSQTSENTDSLEVMVRVGQ